MPPILSSKAGRFRLRFGQPDQIQFVLLPLTQLTVRLGARPERAARHVPAACDLYSNPQDFGVHRSGQEVLISFIGGELNPQLAARRPRVNGVRLELRRQIGKTRATTTRSASSGYTGST